MQVNGKWKNGKFPEISYTQNRGYNSFSGKAYYCTPIENEMPFLLAG